MSNITTQRTSILSAICLLALFLTFSFATHIVRAQTQDDGFQVETMDSYAGRGDVGLYDGSLNFSLPLIGMSGRGSVGFSPELRITGGWEVEKQYDDSYQPQYLMNLSYKGTYAKGLDYANPLVGYGPGVLIFKREAESSNYNWGTALTRLYFYGSGGGRTELRDTATDGQRWGRSLNTGTSRGTRFISNDGSAITFFSDSIVYDKPYCPNNPYCAQPHPYPTGYLKFANGTVYRIDNGAVSWIRDSNGNKMSFTYYPPSQPNYGGPLMSGQIQTATDSNGRVVQFEYDVEDISPYGLCDRITYKGIGGAPRIVRISKKQLSAALKAGESMPDVNCDLFPDYGDVTCPPWQEGCIETVASCILSNPLVASSVYFPDGRHTDFKYNRYGELARVEMPSGGVIEYDHVGYEGDAGGFRNGDPQNNENTFVYRRVSERRTYREGNILEKKETYTAEWGECSPDCGTPWNNRSLVTVETFDGQTLQKLLTSKHYFYGAAWGAMARMGWDYSPWREGREYKTEGLDTNGNVLKRTENDLQQRAFVSWWNAGCSGWQCPPLEASPPVDPRVTEVRNIDVPTNQVSKTRYGYDEFNNQIDIWEYNYGTGSAGALLRYTHVDFIKGSYSDNSNAFTPHLRRLPERQWVASDEMGNNKKSFSEYEYDNYSSGTNHAQLVSRTNVIGHDSNNYNTGTLLRGNPTMVTTYANAQNQTQPNRIFSQYDILGNVVKTVDAKGSVGTIDYTDNFGSPDSEAVANSAPAQLNGFSTFAKPKSVTNALGFINSYTQYDYYTGVVINTQDANGVVVKLIFDDPLDRLTQTVAGIGTAHETQTSVIYDDLNRRVETRGDITSLNDNLMKTECFYDSLGRTYEKRKYELGGYIVNKTEFDALGRVRRVSAPYRPSQNEQPTWSESFYDDLSRVIKVKTADNAEITTAYSGSTTTTTDQAGKQKRSTVDGFGRLVQIDEPNDSGQFDSGGIPVQPTYYQYDPLGNLIEVNQGVQTRTFVYDSLSRMVSATTPESGTISFSYDPNNNLVTKFDSRSITTTFTYDALNRPLTKSYSDLTPTISYTYDDPSIPFSRGKLTKVSSNISTTENLEFDRLGRTTMFRQTTDGQSYNTSYVYNLTGALIEQTYPSGRVVKNTLDSDGHLSEVQSKSTPNGVFSDRADNFIYNAAGIATSLRFGNGKYLSIQFNNRMQPTQIGLGSSLSSHELLKLNYDYGTTNNNGNILNHQISIGQSNQSPIVFTQSYTYDSLNRLKSAAETSGGTQTWKQTYSFDRYGNRQFDVANTTTLAQPYDPNSSNPTISTTNNRITPSQGYIYDLSGNLIQDVAGRSFEYDAENRQKNVSASSTAIGTYFYDGVGNRVKKVTSSETTIFVYDIGGKLIAEYSSEINQNPEVSYLTTDNLGTPRISTDAVGQVIARSDYLPYGEELSNPQRTQVLGYVQDSVEQGFTGYIKDLETSLEFARARMYSNSLGRFTSVDPASSSANTANPQSINRYLYVLNNPLTLVDRTGAFPAFSYYVYFRSFAPFDWFGFFGTNAFRGDLDGRQFSTDLEGPNASYRIGALSSAVASEGHRQFPEVYTRALSASFSLSRYWGDGDWSEAYVDDSYWFPRPDGANFSVYGNDDALIENELYNPAWDIDLHPDWTAKYKERTDGSVEMWIFGEVTGDAFPAAEAFVTDARGNGVMLGVFAVPPDGWGPEPETRLAGNNFRPMIKFNVTILVKDGVFQGVIDPNDSDNLISIAKWNEQFTSQPTRQDAGGSGRNGHPP